MTRTSPRTTADAAHHALNFFLDNDDGCALTTLVRGYRFHIIADPEHLRSESKHGKSIGGEYHTLVSKLRSANEEADNPQGHDGEGNNKKQSKHVDGAKSSFDSGLDTGSEQSPEAADNDDDHDSAVDVTGPEQENDSTPKQAVAAYDDVENAEKAIQSWMLTPFSEIFADLDDPAVAKDEQQSLAEWFSGPTYYYNLEIENDELQPIELESQADLEKRVEGLVPHMHVPKYITDMDIPWFNANDLVVISESDEPEPYHPCRVKAGNNIHFLKLVDTTQPQPVKRELKILEEIESKGLHKQFRVPVLTGLVGYKESKNEIMGFLLTDIADPTPLTKMLDSDVIEEKREKWAMESERIVKILHKNQIIWGDAKADNFIIDRQGDLWIIDFGGSYTEGWVDPELMETKAGDIMGVEKIIHALEDPEANTYEPGEKEADRKTGSPTLEPSKKRSRGTNEDGCTEHQSAPKRPRK